MINEETISTIATSVLGSAFTDEGGAGTWNSAFSDCNATPPGTFKLVCYRAHGIPAFYMYVYITDELVAHDKEESFYRMVLDYYSGEFMGGEYIFKHRAIETCCQALLGNYNLFNELWRVASRHTAFSFCCIKCGAPCSEPKMINKLSRTAFLARVNYPIDHINLLDADEYLCGSCYKDMFSDKPVRSTKGIDYHEYLASPEWKERADERKKRIGKCQIGSPMSSDSLCTQELHVHHNTYERLGREFDSDLVVLCSYHHSLIHGKTEPEHDIFLDLNDGMLRYVSENRKIIVTDKSDAAIKKFIES